MWGIGANEWSTVLKNLADVVKPGGTLQLVEAERVLSAYADEQVQQKKLAQVQRRSTESSGMDVDIWRKFPASARTAWLPRYPGRDLQSRLRRDVEAARGPDLDGRVAPAIVPPSGTQDAE